MRIYRYVPNAKDYSPIAKRVYGQWWPDGVDVDPLWHELFPRQEGHDNHLVQVADHAALPDFPAFSLGLALISERAKLALERLIPAAVPVMVSGKPFYAISPLRCDAFVPKDSSGLQLPGGETFFYTRRSFEPSKIAGEFFTLRAYEPFSDLYVTERLMDIVLQERLTGLEYAELVYADGPVEPVYPAVRRESIPEFTMRRTLEYDLIYQRCSLWCYSENEVQSAVYAAVAGGAISFDYVLPEYRREEVCRAQT